MSTARATKRERQCIHTAGTGRREAALQELGQPRKVPEAQGGIDGIERRVFVRNADNQRMSGIEVTLG